MANERILVVDDSKEIRSFLCESILRPAGYQVLTATDGESAIKTALQHQPDLMLLDINLPRCSGLDVLHTLGIQGCDFPTIMMTFYGSEEAILKSFRLGAIDYLQKPFSLEDVMEAVARALAESRWKKERLHLSSALAQANQELQEQVRTWALLNEIGRTITSTLDEEDAQRRLMRGINQFMKVEAGSLFLMDNHSDQLVLQISLRGQMEKVGGLRLQVGQGIAGWVAQHNRTALVSDVSKDDRFFPGVDHNTGLLSRSILAVPLSLNDKVLGVIQVINPQGNRTQFEKSDQVVLEALAASVAVAVENARLHKQMRQTVAAETIQQTLVTLSHHINNSLQVLSMVAHALKNASPPQSSTLRNKSAETIRTECKRISAVMSVLNKITVPKDTVYQGSIRMLDIEV